MVLATLLETVHEAPAVPTIVVGLGAFAILMIGLVWVVGMGLGRPHNK